jgi:hypothetical protein
MTEKNFLMRILFAATFLFIISPIFNHISGNKLPGSKEAKNTISTNSLIDKYKEKDTIVGMELQMPKPGRTILETGRYMALEEKTIVKGSCWTWVNEVFNRSGFAKSKEIVFKSKKTGPYADLNLIEPGDWLYYINYSYRGTEHSGIFVYWKDFENKKAVVLSYGGRNRKEPGRYLIYDLKSVYYITRAADL